MREAVLLGSYSNTIEKELALIETILDWKKHNIPIILSTHFPESERVQNLVDYYIFDKNQHLDKQLTVNQYYSCKSFIINAPANRPYHAAAGLISLQNALRGFQNKFDFIYLQDYDVQLDKEKALNICRNLYSSEFEIFMMNWKNNPDAYATNVCFFKQGGFNKIWGDIQSVQDYLDLVKLTNQNQILIEHLAKNLIEVKNLKSSLYLFNEDQQKQLITNFSKHSADVDEPRIYMSTTSTGGAVLFVVNPIGNLLNFRIQTKNLINNEETNQQYQLEGKISMFWKFYENSYVKITCDDIQRSYFVTPFNTFTECTFKFFDDTPLIIKQ